MWNGGGRTTPSVFSTLPVQGLVVASATLGPVRELEAAGRVGRAVGRLVLPQALVADEGPGVRVPLPNPVVDLRGLLRLHLGAGQAVVGLAIPQAASSVERHASLAGFGIRDSLVFRPLILLLLLPLVTSTVPRVVSHVGVRPSDEAIGRGSAALRGAGLPLLLPIGLALAAGPGHGGLAGGLVTASISSVAAVGPRATAISISR